MNEQNKTIRYAFYFGVVIFFVFAYCYFSTSSIDGRRSNDVGTRIEHSEKLNRQVQNGIENSKAKVSRAVTGIGAAESELDRAAASIERCQQILEGAKRRTQETGEADK